MPIPSIFWLAAMVVFFVAEAITVGLTSIWFGVGALAALIISFFTGNIWVQIAVFLAASVLCLLAVRPLAQRYVTPKQVPTNADRVVGMEGIVTEAIDNLKARGQVSVGGSVWTARTEDARTIPKDSLVRVLRIEGVKIIVAPAEEPAAAQEKKEEL